MDKLFVDGICKFNLLNYLMPSKLLISEKNDNNYIFLHQE